MVLIKEATYLSFKNKDRLVSDEVSCYNCIRHFKTSEVVEWVDNGLTAICPHCSIDSILDGNVEDETLNKMHVYWFKGFI